MVKATICLPKLLEPSVELLDFAQRQVRDAKLHDDSERRMEPRTHTVVPVLVQPLDLNFDAAGDPFAVVSRDFTPGGIGLLHTDPIEPGFLALHFSIEEETINLVIEVLWCRGRGPFFYFGGKFVRTLKDFPAQH